ncbi:MAG: hypothetical protein KGD65_01140 [Candidatus Lokiarchaeota archaeon]|nr:hypothetical protein [Candidatus Lokiarchaeota archaeon]
MFKCEICGKNIKYQNLKYVFQFTLGDMSAGNFTTNNSDTYYYHVECLDKFEKSETKFMMPLK